MSSVYEHVLGNGAQSIYKNIFVTMNLYTIRNIDTFNFCIS